MFTVQMLPIVIVALIIQLFILIWCIRKVYFNGELNEVQKTLWICAIILLQVLGILAYLFFTRKKSIAKNMKDLGNKFDENIKHVIFLVLFYTFEILTFAIIYSNKNNIWIVILSSAATVLMIVIHLYREKMNKVVAYILPYILITIVTSTELLSLTQDYKIIILVAVAAIIIEYPLSYSKTFFWGPLFLFQIGSLIKTYSLLNQIPPNYLIGFVFKNTVTYMLVITAFYFVKRQLIMNNYLQYLLIELKSKTQELEEASILKERNRIAREIHDSLGHTLTGAIIQLEVAKQLLYASPEKAEVSIQKTQDITRHGFNDVKRAIKALRPIVIEDNTLDDGLSLLFERMEKDYNFKVDNDINLPDSISDDLKISVYRIVQELITNSVRHGKASEMKLSIEHQFDTLRINCNDNGKGCSSIKEGNGINGIRERIAKFGGHAEFSSQVNNGFGAIIYIPL